MPFNCPTENKGCLVMGWSSDTPGSRRQLENIHTQSEVNQLDDSSKEFTMVLKVWSPEEQLRPPHHFETVRNVNYLALFQIIAVHPQV